MKRFARITAVTLIVVALIAFIGYTFYTLAHPPAGVLSAPFGDAPVKVYGVVEPEGRATYLTPPQAKRVAELFVGEGDAVGKGQKILSLESRVEAAELAVALARVEVLRKTVLLGADELVRTKNLFEGGGKTEYEYVSARLRHETNEASLAAASSEVELARRILEQLTLTSPVDGIVYKLDVRVGETIGPGDGARIVLGPAHLNVRLFVESFWIGRIERASSFEVLDVETGAPLGTGRVVSLSRYLGAKRIRTEDQFERQDTNYQEVVLSFEPKAEIVPIGLPVYVTFAR